MPKYEDPKLDPESKELLKSYKVAEDKKAAQRDQLKGTVEKRVGEKIPSLDDYIPREVERAEMRLSGKLKTYYDELTATFTKGDTPEKPHTPAEKSLRRDRLTALKNIANQTIYEPKKRGGQGKAFIDQQLNLVIRAATPAQRKKLGLMQLVDKHWDSVVVKNYNQYFERRYSDMVEKSRKAAEETGTTSPEIEQQLDEEEMAAMKATLSDEDFATHEAQKAAEAERGRTLAEIDAQKQDKPQFTKKSGWSRFTSKVKGWFGR